jgi:hypothetical protein
MPLLYDVALPSPAWSALAVTRGRGRLGVLTMSRAMYAPGSQIGSRVAEELARTRGWGPLVQEIYGEMLTGQAMAGVLSRVAGVPFAAAGGGGGPRCMRRCFMTERAAMAKARARGRSTSSTLARAALSLPFFSRVPPDGDVCIAEMTLPPRARAVVRKHRAARPDGARRRARGARGGGGRGDAGSVASRQRLRDAVWAYGRRVRLVRAGAHY